MSSNSTEDHETLRFIDWHAGDVTADRSRPGPSSDGTRSNVQYDQKLPFDCREDTLFGETNQSVFGTPCLPSLGQEWNMQQNQPVHLPFKDSHGRPMLLSPHHRFR